MAFLRMIGRLEDYRRWISEGKAQLHAFSEGFAITEVKDYTYPSERVLNVLMLGGKRFDSWKEEADRKLGDFARVNGCQAIEFACRTGLEKKVAELGYRKKRVYMRKELECGRQEQENSAAPA